MLFCNSDNIQKLFECYCFFLYWLAESVWPSVWVFIAKERYDWSTLFIGLSYNIFGIGQIIVITLILPYFSKRWSNWYIAMLGLLFALFATHLQYNVGWFICFLRVPCLNISLCTYARYCFNRGIGKCTRKIAGSDDICYCIEFDI